MKYAVLVALLTVSTITLADTQTQEKAFDKALKQTFLCINASTTMKIIDADNILGWDVILGRYMRHMNRVIDQYTSDIQKRKNMKNNVQFMAITAQQDISNNKLPRLIGNQSIPFDKFVADMKKQSSSCVEFANKHLKK